jgi:hypothetical protein
MPPSPHPPQSDSNGDSRNRNASVVYWPAVTAAVLMAVLIVAGVLAFLNRPKPPEGNQSDNQTAQGNSTPIQPEKETPPQIPHDLLSPVEGQSTTPEKPLDKSHESQRVNGHGWTHGLDAESLPPPPPPTPKPPPLPSPPATQVETRDADLAFEKRLLRSEDELRAELHAVPELRLLSDLEIQSLRRQETKGVTPSPYTLNVLLNRGLRQAGVQAGLPIKWGPQCQLDSDSADVMQTLSKDLRRMGFVSVPAIGSSVSFASGKSVKVAGSGLNSSPKEKVEAFREWCDANQIERFSGAMPALVQMLQVEDEPTRLLLVQELSKVIGPGPTAGLAGRAMADLSPKVRETALEALRKRPPNEYLPLLLLGLRYPFPPVADRAAWALAKLKDKQLLPKLVGMLDLPSPALPVLDKNSHMPVIRELVRINHMRNCLLCHAPSADANDGMVRAPVPTPNEKLPAVYYDSSTGRDFVRADITFLRQDFSTNLKVPNAAPWPEEQRFDFVTCLRRVDPKTMRDMTAVASPDYPQRDAVLYALRHISGKDAGKSSAKWRDILSIPAPPTKIETKQSPPEKSGIDKPKLGDKPASDRKKKDHLPEN